MAAIQRHTPKHFSGVDHFVLNEAELTLPGFLKDLDQGRARRIYSTDKYADMGQAPTPRWDLLELKHYATLSLQYSRGCPFNCDFCNITTLLGRTPRNKTASQIISELDSLYVQGWRGGIFTRLRPAIVFSISNFQFPIFKTKNMTWLSGRNPKTFS